MAGHLQASGVQASLVQAVQPEGTGLCVQRVSAGLCVCVRACVCVCVRACVCVLGCAVQTPTPCRMVLSIGSEWLASSLLQLLPHNRTTAHDAMRHEYFACLPQAVHSIDNCESLGHRPGVMVGWVGVGVGCGCSGRGDKFLSINSLWYTCFQMFRPQ